MWSLWVLLLFVLLVLLLLFFFWSLWESLPKVALALKPLKFFWMIKLTTPATASEPQAAEAPPVTTSTRWMMPLGRVGRSTPPIAGGPPELGLEVTTRWPSNRTRVRTTPKPRRSTVSRPASPWEELPECEPLAS